MKIKPLTLSKGERDVKAILEDRFSGTPFQVWGKVRLGSVIEKEAHDHLSSDLFDYLTRAELDYIIFHRSPPNPPLLAVEFDGPYHEVDPKQQENDLRKNRLCQMARLPLLRVRYEEIEPLFTRDSFLSHVVEVVLRYKKAHENKRYAPPQYPDAFTEREYDEIKRHDLTDIQRLQHKLATNHRIISLHRKTKFSNARFGYEFWLSGVDNRIETYTTYSGRLVLKQLDQNLTREQWPEVYQISKAINFATYYRTTDEPRPPLDLSDLTSLDAFVNWAESDPLYSPELPGISWTYVAWNILEALCLKQLLADADGGKLQGNQK